MRNIITMLCIMLLWPTGKACGQKFEIIGGIGIGQCRMQDLKKIQDQRLGSLNLPAKITDDFPWTIHYSAEWNAQVKNFSVGFAYFFLTTGSRISYSDYSGEIALDLTAVSHGFGPSIMFPLYKTDNTWVGPRFQFPLLYSRVTEKDYISLLDETETGIYMYYSWSVGMLTSIEAKYRLKRWAFALNIGYLLDSKGRLMEDNETTIYFTNKGYYTTNWSGLQLDFRLGYTLFK